jgi:hypothetical protein
MSDNIEIADVAVSASEAELTSEKAGTAAGGHGQAPAVEELLIKVQVVPAETAQNAALGSGSWASVPEPLRRFVIEPASEQIIPVTIKLPKSAKPGTYSFHILVASDRRPEVEFSQSSAIQLNLIQKIRPPCRWCWVAMGGAVVALAVVLGALITRGPSSVAPGGHRALRPLRICQLTEALTRRDRFGIVKF